MMSMMSVCCMTSEHFLWHMEWRRAVIYDYCRNINRAYCLYKLIFHIYKSINVSKLLRMNMFI